MKKNIDNVSQSDIDIIEQAGYLNIKRLASNYDEVELRILEEQRKAKRELQHLRECLAFWETGVTYLLRYIPLITLAACGLGYLFSGQAMYLITWLDLPPKVWISASFGVLTVCAINTYDLGRMVVGAQKHMSKKIEQEDLETFIINHFGEPITDPKSGGWKLHSALMDTLEFSCSSMEFGVAMRKAGYLKKRTGKGFTYLIANQDVF